MSCVMGQMSHTTCHMSNVTFFFLFFFLSQNAPHLMIENFVGHSIRVYYYKSRSVLRRQMALAGRQEQIILKKKTSWGESITVLGC